MRRKQLSIALLHGGPSAERAVSLKSGEAIAAALVSRGHRVDCVDPSPMVPHDAQSFGGSALIVAAARELSSKDWTDVDIVFNALHGVFGEDGQAQRILDDLGVPYTGSGELASKRGFQKGTAKGLFEAAGVPTPRGVVCEGEWPIERMTLAAESLGYPLVVKPEAQGSSLGVTIVRSVDELMPAVVCCRRYGSKLLLEEFIAGTEWTVPIWDDVALPVVQVVAADEFYDYSAKYSDDRTEYRFEFDVPATVVESVVQAAQSAARSLQACGLVRADIRLTDEGLPFVLEVNTSPGMTDHSLVPKSAERMGLSLGELCEEECLRALQRYQQRRRRRA